MNTLIVVAYLYECILYIHVILKSGQVHCAKHINPKSLHTTMTYNETKQTERSKRTTGLSPAAPTQVGVT